VAILGGMFSSTFLTLLVIPVVYTVFSDALAWFRKRLLGAAGPKQPTASASGGLHDAAGKPASPD
jgi:hypothetical protein